MFEMEHFCRVDNTLSELIEVVRQKLFVQEKSITWIYSNGSELSDNVNICFEAGIAKLALKLMTT